MTFSIFIYYFLHQHSDLYKNTFDFHFFNTLSKMHYNTNFYYLIMFCRVANSHAYGVILTHLTCYSRTHAIDKFTHALKKITRILTQFYKIENNLLVLIIVTFVRLSVTLFNVFLLQNHSL